MFQRLNKIQHGDLSYYRFDLWPSLTHGIFTRNGGTSVAPWSSLNVGGNVGDEPHAQAQHMADDGWQWLMA
jgi:copper oxidase (laccase) domain-containing protein